MMNLLIALAFVFMVVAPCMVAMKTGLHEGSDDAQFDDSDELLELAARRGQVPD